MKLRITTLPGLYSGDDIRDIVNISIVHSSMVYNNEGFKEYDHTELKFEKWTEYDFTSYPTYAVNLTGALNAGENYEYCFNLTNTSIAGSVENPNIYEYIAFRVDIWPNLNWLAISETSGDIFAEVIFSV